MNAPVFFSPRVLSTINSLPDQDRQAIASAITGEFILGADTASSLTPVQSLLYALIRQYVVRDSQHLACSE